MSKYTAELRAIVENDFNIFDFEYQRTAESQAVVSNEDLQKGFINHYYFREVGFETLERFKHKLKTQWLESLGELDNLLVAYSKPIEVKSNVSSSGEHVAVFNDAPKNALDFGEQSQHATNIMDNKNNSKGYMGVTEIELLEIYHDKIKDIQTEFYKSFDNLFMQIF